MTTSTDKPSTTPPNDLPPTTEGKAKKSKKKKGPIRFEAIGAIILFSGLSYGYGHFFMDSHLKAAAEWTATRVHGAEVNISNIKTSFFKGSFQMKGLQVTNKDKPTENMLQLGEVRFQFLWDALLRAKFVVEDASIENIQINVPRKKPGRVLPKKETAVGSVTESETAKEFEKAVIAKGMEKYSGNALGDVAAILGGKDPSDQLKDMSGELKTEGRINDLMKELEEKEKLWDQRIESLTDKKQLDELADRAKNYKFNKKNPVKSVKELGDILEDAKKKVKEFNVATKELKSDVKKYSDFVGNVDNMIDEDINAMMKRLKIPDVDVADLSKEIFAQMFLGKLGEYKKYADMAREYAPPKKTAEEKAMKKADQMKAKERGVGKNYHFPKKKGYPFFWLKKSIISSKATNSEFSGDISGEITNVTNEPVLLGLPAKLSFEGDFPHQKVEGVKGTITVDRTQDKPLDVAKMTVAKFPVGKQKFSSSKELTLEMTEAMGSSEFNMRVEDQKVEVEVLNKFNDTKYNVDAAGREVKEIITKVVTGIPMISLNASARGSSWGKLNWSINSNFGKELGSGIKREVKAKIDAAKKKVEDHVKNKIRMQKEKLDQKLAAAKNKVEQQIASKKAEIDKAKNQVESQVNAKKNESKKSTKKATKKAVDKLKKKLKKFKF